MGYGNYGNNNQSQGYGNSQGGSQGQPEPKPNYPEVLKDYGIVVFGEKKALNFSLIRISGTKNGAWDRDCIQVAEMYKDKNGEWKFCKVVQEWDSGDPSYAARFRMELKDKPAWAQSLSDVMGKMLNSQNQAPPPPPQEARY